MSGVSKPGKNRHCTHPSTALRRGHQSASELPPKLRPWTHIGCEQATSLAPVADERDHAGKRGCCCLIFSPCLFCSSVSFSFTVLMRDAFRSETLAKTVRSRGESSVPERRPAPHRPVEPCPVVVVGRATDEQRQERQDSWPHSSCSGVLLSLQGFV